MAGGGFFSWLVLMALDAVRFRWSQMPLPLQGSGVILLLASFALFFLTFRENAYLSPAVRIQRDRGQVVVSTGPYRHVRHPMYAAFILYALGTTLLLGSWWGLLPAVALIVMMAWRSVREEDTLREELPGYREYMATVKYRLIPYLW
jgi:protein-S-isoprenylcysteine O-methyltransferase Ste14